MPAPAVDDAQVDATVDARRPRPGHGSPSGVESDGVVDDVGDRPLQQCRVGAHRQEASRARRRRRRPRRGPRLSTAAGTTSSSGVGASAGCTTPAWIRLMSRRLPTSAVSRSVSVVDRLRRTRRRRRSDQSTSRWRGSMHDALIEASGVRRSCETACSSALAARCESARPRARPASTREPAVLEHRGELGGEGVEDQLVLGGDARTVEGEHDVRRSAPRPSPRHPGRRQPAVPGGGLDLPTRARRPAQHRRAVERERGSQVLDSAGSGSSSAVVAASRASVRAWPRRVPLRWRGVRRCRRSDSRTRRRRGTRTGRRRSRPRRSSTCRSAA